LSINELIQSLNGITSATNESQLVMLDATLIKLSEHPQRQLALPALFQIFERFPDDDGFEVFWSIVHLLESIDGYELELMKSLERQPVDFTLMMVNRLLNANVKTIGNYDLMVVLQNVPHDEKQSTQVRDAAQRFLNHQLNQA
jgi:hypothetical protein